MNDKFENRYTYEILSRYIFDRATPPAELADSKLIRDSAAQASNKQIDAHWYITEGPGRFGFASLSPLIQAFFELDEQGEYKHQLNGRAVPYGRDELVTFTGAGLIPGLKSSKLFFQQFNYDDGGDNFGERVFIWGSSALSVGNSVQFHVDPTTGERFIRNLSLQDPNAVNSEQKQEDFDFVGGSEEAQKAANFGRSYVDPSKIGRTLKFTFTNNWLVRETGRSHHPKRVCFPCHK